MLAPPVMIRLARPCDLSAIPAIERSAATLFRGTHMDFPASFELNSMDNLVAALRRGLLWVAELADGPQGFLFAEITASGLYIRELSVAVAAQRRGLGSGLMAAAIAEARHRGLRAVLLTTDRSLAWNAPFYARLGFAIIADEAIPIDVARRLAGQYAAGFDPKARCAMRLGLE